MCSSTKNESHLLEWSQRPLSPRKVWGRSYTSALLIGFLCVRVARRPSGLVRVVSVCDQQVAILWILWIPPDACNPGRVVYPRFIPLVTKHAVWLVSANGRWFLADGKVTVALASHWPRVTDVSGSPPTGPMPRRGRWAPAYAVLVQYGELYLFTCTNGRCVYQRLSAVR